MLTPNGLLPAGGNDGRLYVLDRDHLGKKPPRRASSSSAEICGRPWWPGPMDVRGDE
jgi:hypothetical protein